MIYSPVVKNLKTTVEIKTKKKIEREDKKTEKEEESSVCYIVKGLG